MEEGQEPGAESTGETQREGGPAVPEGGWVGKGPERAAPGSPRVDLADGNVEPGSDVLHSLIALGDDAHALGNGLCRDGVVARDHDDLQARCSDAPAPPPPQPQPFLPQPHLASP